MPASGPTYYEILGLTPGAAAADIRKRYRELARRYHPDVARTPDAARRFTEINEAHSVLSDPAKRANYDASLKLQEFRRANEQTGRQGDKETSPPIRNPQSAIRNPNAQRPTPNAGPRPTTQRPNDPTTGLLEQARKAMARRRFREAELLCRQANRVRRTSEAFEILGDVCRARGRADDAVAMYSYALQLDRANRSVQAKFDKLVGQPSGPTMAGHAAQSARAAHAAQAAGPPLRAGPAGAKAQARGLATGVGLLIVAFLVAVVALTRNPPATSAWVFEWDGLLVFALAASGAVAGFLGAANSLLAPARAELFQIDRSRGRGPAVPLGAVLLAFDALSFYAAAVIYLVVAAATGSTSRSTLAAFAAASILAAVFAAAAPVSAGWILLSGPNVVFFALVLGWAAGRRDEG